MRMNSINPVLSLAAALLLSVPQAHASDWDMEVAPYLWVAGIDGSIKVNRNDYNISASFSDIIDQTKFGGSVILAAVKGHWVNYAQLDYLALENDDIQASRGPLDLTGSLEFDSFLATFASGYRFELGATHSVDLMLGLRYAGLDGTVKLDGIFKDRKASANQDLYDGLLVLRPRFQLSEKWYFEPLFSVGTGDSDLTWEVFPQMIYQSGSLQFRFGYRDLNYDQKDNGDEIDISMRGALIGMGYQF